MTSRMLPPSLIKHLLDMVGARTISTIERQDEKLAKKGELATKRDDFTSLACDEEAQLLKLEAEMRAAGGTPLPWNDTRQ